MSNDASIPENPQTYHLPEKTSYGAPDIAKYISDLSLLVSYASKLGIRTHTTRIGRYLEFLKQREITPDVLYEKYFKSSIGEPFLSRYDWDLYLAREIQELAWISRGLIGNAPEGLGEKIVEIFGGSDFATLDCNTKARNTQFELRIASYFGRADCKVDLSTQTDIITELSDYSIYIECKRIESMHTLQKRVDEAYKQIVAKMPDIADRNFGIIAVDVTKAAFPHNGIVIGMSDDHSRQIIQQKLRYIASHIRHASIFASRRITEIWLQIHIANLTINPAILSSRFSSYYIINEKLEDGGMRAAKMIHGAMDRATKFDIESYTRVTKRLRKGFLIENDTRFGFDEALIDDYIKNGFKETVDPNLPFVWMKTPAGEESSVLYGQLILVSESQRIELVSSTKDAPQIAIKLYSHISFLRDPYENDD